MTTAHPRRLRAEPALPPGLREALRELPNAAPSSNQLAELREQLGLSSLTLQPPARSALVADPRLKERRLRRTVIALLFFPVAATAAVSTVIDLRQHREPSTTVAANSTTPLTGSRSLQSVVHGSPSSTVVSTVASSAVLSSASLEGALPPPSDSAASVARQRTTPNSTHSGGQPARETRVADVQATAATEVELLQRANAALRGDPAQALALAAEHRQRFPHGNLAQEREVIAIKAWVGLGDSARAADSLARFERAYPRSAYALELQQIVH